MPKYQYSIIRFVPSPTRGEFVNVGVIVGNDATDEWTMEVVGKKSRAAKLDDTGILPLVSTELERLQLRFPGDDEEVFSAGKGFRREANCHAADVQFTASGCD